MLKIRLMGTKNTIKWFKKVLYRHPKIKVLECSDFYRNQGTNRFYRVYVKVERCTDK